MKQMGTNHPDKNEKPHSDEHDRAVEEEVKKEVKKDLTAYTMGSQIGLMIVIPIVLGAAAGHWLDEKFGTGIIFFLILLLAGIAGGFYSAYDQVMTVMKLKK
jgi:ATP synthase protein I